MPMDSGENTRKGFTLAELIAVLAILGVLAGVTVPAMVSFIDKAEETRLIGECRACVTAAQLLMAMSFAEGEEHGEITLGEIAEAAGVSGEVKDITFDASGTLIDMLNYDGGGKSVRYSRLPKSGYSFTAGT